MWFAPLKLDMFKLFFLNKKETNFIKIFYVLDPLNNPKNNIMLFYFRNTK